jgi:hypothetical protein
MKQWTKVVPESTMSKYRLMQARETIIHTQGSNADKDGNGLFCIFKAMFKINANSWIFLWYDIEGPYSGI